jgi:hypothetical protein
MTVMSVGSPSYADARVESDDRSSVLRLRVRGEFDEMPGLCLLVEQAARLFGLGQAETEVLLESLVAEGYLRRTARGFVRGWSGR